VSGRKTIWRLVLPIALLALILGTTFGVVWHHHATSSPDNCPICHLSHQALEPAPASARISILIPAGAAPEFQNFEAVLTGTSRQIAARAPPA
jgi:hypothetical protein